MAGLIDASALLADLVAIKSVNTAFGGSGEAELGDFVADWLRRRGVDVARQEVAPGRNNVIGLVRAGSGPALLLDAHLDTVTADNWLDGDPWVPQLKGGRLYGRGSCDTKASMAVFMALMAGYAANPGKLNRPLAFSATVDEEDRQTGAYRLLDHDFGVAVGCAIAGEPTLCRLIHAHKGLVRFQIETRGKAAHASNPGLGDNAIVRMGRVLERLDEVRSGLDRREPHPDLGLSTLNPGTINGGTAVNVVPDRCVLEVDRRLLPGESAESALGEIRRVLAAESQWSLTPHYDRPPLETPVDQPFVGELSKAIESGGRDGHPTVAPYLTNAVAFAERGVPSVVFGPGDVAEAHTDHEFVELSELDCAAGILRTFLEK